LVPLCAGDANGAPKWPLPESPSSPLRFLSYSPQSGLGRILNAVWAKRVGHLYWRTFLRLNLQSRYCRWRDRARHCMAPGDARRRRHSGRPPC
jgi:hypothetical protein